MKDDLPPLPEPHWPKYYHGSVPSGGYTKDQMHEYARAALNAVEDALEESLRQMIDAGLGQLEAEQTVSNCPDQPVAYLWQHSETGRTRVVMPDQIITTDATWFVVGPLYLAPPRRKPLTEAEIDAIPCTDGGSDWEALMRFARAIEAAHGIKGE